MKRSTLIGAAAVLVIAGLIAFLAFWPPSIKMVTLSKDAIPPDTLAAANPVLEGRGKPYVLRAYGRGEGYEAIGYTTGGIYMVWFRQGPSGDCGASPFDAHSSFVTDPSTKVMTSFHAWGIATDKRVVKVVATDAQGKKYETVPQNGFWWFWINSTGKWRTFEAVDKNGRVLYTKAAYPPAE